MHSAVLLPPVTIRAEEHSINKQRLIPKLAMQSLGVHYEPLNRKMRAWNFYCSSIDVCVL